MSGTDDSLLPPAQPVPDATELPLGTMFCADPVHLKAPIMGFCKCTNPPTPVCQYCLRVKHAPCKDILDPAQYRELRSKDLERNLARAQVTVKRAEDFVRRAEEARHVANQKRAEVETRVKYLVEQIHQFGKEATEEWTQVAAELEAAQFVVASDWLPAYSAQTEELRQLLATGSLDDIVRKGEALGKAVSHDEKSLIGEILAARIPLAPSRASSKRTPKAAKPAAAAAAATTPAAEGSAATTEAPAAAATGAEGEGEAPKVEEASAAAATAAATAQDDEEAAEAAAASAAAAEGRKEEALELARLKDQLAQVRAWVSVSVGTNVASKSFLRVLFAADQKKTIDALETSRPRPPKPARAAKPAAAAAAAAPAARPGRKEPAPAAAAAVAPAGARVRPDAAAAPAVTSVEWTISHERDIHVQSFDGRTTELSLPLRERALRQLQFGLEKRSLARNEQINIRLVAVQHSHIILALADAPMVRGVDPRESGHLIGVVASPGGQQAITPGAGIHVDPTVPSFKQGQTVSIARTGNQVTFSRGSGRSKTVFWKATVPAEAALFPFVAVYGSDLAAPGAPATATEISITRL